MKIRAYVVTGGLMLALFPLWGLAAAEVAIDNAYMKAYRVQESFDGTREFLEAAIGERGIKINNISHIGKMLDRTAQAVGTSNRVYVQAKAVEFCSAVVSREMMEADANNIVFCPYIIYVYELAAKPGEVYIGYRKPVGPGDKASLDKLAKVTELLEAIIGDVVE